VGKTEAVCVGQGRLTVRNCREIWDNFILRQSFYNAK